MKNIIGTIFLGLASIYTLIIAGCVIFGCLTLTGCGKQSNYKVVGAVAVLDSNDFEQGEKVSISEYKSAPFIIIEGKWSGWEGGYYKENIHSYDTFNVGDTIFNKSNNLGAKFEVKEIKPDSITLNISDGALTTVNKETGGISLLGDPLKEITINKGDVIELATMVTDASKIYTLIYNGMSIKETEETYNIDDIDPASLVIYEDVMTMTVKPDEQPSNKSHRFETIKDGEVVYDKFGSTIEIADVTPDTVVLTIDGFIYNGEGGISTINLKKGDTIELRTDTMDSGAILSIKYNGV